MDEPSYLQPAWVKPTAETPFVISSSSLSTFTECRKKYQIQYEWMLENAVTPSYMEQGSSFHKMMETFNNIQRGTVEPTALAAFTEDETFPVFKAYLLARAIPHQEKVAEILLAEEPIYVQVFEHVYLRVTLDVVERLKDGTVQAVDYKTFAKAETWNTDLDFQARLYSAILEIKYPGVPCQFEHRKVRRMAPGVPKNPTQQAKADKGLAFESWTEDECYEEILTIYSKRELRVVWAEMQDKVRDLLRAREEQRFYRIPAGWRTGIGSCANCTSRNICVAEINETLDDALISEETKKRSPLVVDPKQLLGIPPAVL